MNGYPNGTGTTTYAYNLAGWKTSITDPGGSTTTYAYNLDGWVTATTNPNGYTATTSYDQAGHVTSTVDYAGRTTNYTYNYAGWLTSETWAGGSFTATYSYNLDGELTAATDPASTYAFSYDNNGKLTQTQVSYPGVSGMGTVSLNYGYQFFGERTSLSDNKGGSIAYSYNNDLQITALNYTQGTNHANVGFSYNIASPSNMDGSLAKITMDAGTGTDHLTANYSYTANALSIHYSDSSANSLPSLNYTMDNAGRVSTSTGPEGSLTYAYDKDGQLTLVTDTNAGTTLYNYSLDANGNRTGTGYTTAAHSGNQMTYDPAENASTAITYDHDGNMTSKKDGSGNTWTYAWDYRNRLKEVVEKNSGNTTILTEDFYYDVFNNLIGVASGVVTPTVQHWTVYDGKNPYMDFDASGNVTTHYLTNPQTLDQFLARVAASGSNPVDWYLTDYQGSIREIVKQNGTVLDTINYDPFGTMLASSSTGSDLGRFLFQGGEWDNNIKLYHFGARWNNPADGRWISQDPIGFAGGDTNLYRFIDNDPVNLTDHTGTSDTVLIELPINNSRTEWFAVSDRNLNHIYAALGDNPSPEFRTELRRLEREIMRARATMIEGGNPALISPAPQEDPIVMIAGATGLIRLLTQLAGLFQTPGSSGPTYQTDPTQPPGQGYQWVGNGPVGSSQGSWYNPTTGESLHPDLNHALPIGPHYDYVSPTGQEFRLMPNGSLVPK